MRKKNRTKKTRQLRTIETLENRQLMHGHSLPIDETPMGPIAAEQGEMDQADDLQAGFDFGDAPNVYRTVLANLGPVHRIDPGVYLGNRVDPDADGQPSLGADGDDVDSLLDDEDGIRMLTSLSPGGSSDVEVTASVDGYVTAWIDWQRDGSFDAVDQIFAAQPVKAGVNTLAIAVPPQASAVDTYARYRFTSANSVLAPTRDPEAQSPNDLPDGEVEDYRVEIIDSNEVTLDFGDAPDSYGTLRASDGPRHRIDAGIFLGAGAGIHLDAEPDGQPHPTAKGDDLTPTVLNDDEDGVRFVGNIVPGSNVTVQIAASTDGFVNAWFDFDQDGTFAVSEKVLNGQAVVPGTNTLSIAVPAEAVESTDNPTFARFRFSQSNRFLPATALPGLADFQRPDGEVEDYAVEIVAAEDADTPLFDFGSLLAPYLPDFVAVRPGFSIGAAVAGEEGPNQSPTADEVDGVFLGEDEWVWTYQGEGTLTVMADWNEDGEFSPEESTACDAASVADGLQECTVSLNDIFSEWIPIHPSGTQINVRGKFESTEANSDGIPYGEIVDLTWIIPQANIDGQEYFDFGDAPLTYDTLLADDGPRHKITDGVRLGRRIDREPDGQPSLGAWRDDATNRDDEDGVRFTSAIAPGGVATVDVGVSGGNGLLDAWMDFNQDGTFAPNEQIFTNEPVTPGWNSLSFNVPNVNWNPLFTLYSRFRVSTAGSLTPKGPAEDGEVEDYATLPGDLNNDGQINIQDADLLQSAIQGDNDMLSATLDLNGDGELNRAEMKYFRENIFLSVEGDLDGDGDSDFTDFLKFSENFGKRDAKYSEGDLDGDGESTFSDFLAFSSNFGTSMERPSRPLYGTTFGGDNEIVAWPQPGIFLDYTFLD